MAIDGLRGRGMQVNLLECGPNTYEPAGVGIDGDGTPPIIATPPKHVPGMSPHLKTPCIRYGVTLL